MALIEIGSTFGGYVVEAELGRGGMGVVYRAEQPALGRRVALKVIAPELAGQAGFRERFERESRLAAAIEHPNVLPIYEAGEAEDGTLFLAMRYIEGTDLRALIRKHGRLDPARAAAIVEQVAAALDEAHSHGLVHRDVKPANVLIGTRGARDHAYLADFGLTKRTASTGGLTASGQWVGTPDYVPPEQVEGERVDARTDVYALGCVLFEALAGRVAYPKASDVAKLFAHVNDPPPRPSAVVPGLPGDLDRVIERALAKDPADRFPSAGDLGRAATAAARGEAASEPERTVAAGAAAPEARAHAPPTVAAPEPEPAVAPEPRAARPPTVGAPLEPSARRRRLLAGLGAAAVLAAILTGGALALGVLGNGGGESELPPGETDREEAVDERDRGQREQPRGLEFSALRTPAFTAQVPAEWTREAIEAEADDGNMRTALRDPGGTTRLAFNRRPGQEVDAVLPAAQDDLPEAYEELRAPTQDTVGDREAVRWEFRLNDRDFGPNSQAVAFFFDAGGSNYRIQATWSRDAGDDRLAKQAARRATATLRPRG